MQHGFNDDKTKAPFGIKAITTYEDEVELQNPETHYALFTTSGAHNLEKCIVQMEISKIYDTPISSDNYNHYISGSIVRVNQESPTMGDGIVIRYIITDSSQITEQYPIQVTARFKITEFY